MEFSIRSRADQSEALKPKLCQPIRCSKTEATSSAVPHPPAVDRSPKSHTLCYDSQICRWASAHFISLSQSTHVVQIAQCLLWSTLFFHLSSSLILLTLYYDMLTLQFLPSSPTDNMLFSLRYYPILMDAQPRGAHKKRRLNVQAEMMCFFPVSSTWSFEL